MATITVTVPDGLEALAATGYGEPLNSLIQSAVNKRCEQIAAHCAYTKEKTRKDKLAYLEANNPAEAAKVDAILDKVNAEDLKPVEVEELTPIDK